MWYGMTKKEAREAIKETYGNSEYTDEIIKTLEQEPKTWHWILVSERLPEEDGEYLVTTINGDVDIYVFHTWGAKSPKVIAWMPLPEPYKAESEE